MPSAKFEIKRKCQYYGNTFIAKTLDSKYCSRRCSQRAYDQREAAKKRMSQLNDIVENIPEARDYISVHEAVAMFGISRALPKTYHLEPEDCYTIGEISKIYGIDDSTVYAHIRKYLFK